MLVSFVIKNFKSIKDVIEVDFTSTGQHVPPKHKNLFIDTNGVTINRLNFFYGKNGAGKSNIVKALQIFLGIIRRDFFEFPGMIPYHLRHGRLLENTAPFKLGEQVDPLTFFSLVFVANQNTYRYSLSINNQKRIIEDERLEHLKGGDYVIMFSKRDSIFSGFSKTEQHIVGTYKNEKVTLLSLIASRIKISSKETRHHITNVMTFFESISFGFTPVSDQESIEQLLSDKNNGKSLTDDLLKFDLSIENIAVSKKERNITFEDYKKSYFLYDSSVEEDNIDDLIRMDYEMERFDYRISTVRNGKELSFYEESDGTKAIANILYSLHYLKKRIWIIDDFENDLHTETSLQLLKYMASSFLDMQFIFVTHELEIMDLEEVHHKGLHYIITRNEKDYNTNVVRLSDYKDLRNDERHSWRNFYKAHRFEQYPDITINDKEK